VIVVLTGGDASGKATQSKILAERLGATLFAFPDYSTPTGKAILGNLTGSWEVHRDSNADHHECCYKVPEVNALVLQSLMNTNRIERTVDLKAAASRGHVVLDRFDVDGLVYGTLDGLDPAWLEQLNEQLPVKPDLYVLLDVPVEEGFKRRPERRDRYERDAKRMEAVSAAYVKLFRDREKWGNWRIVDGVGSVEEVAERVRAVVWS
jgi:thymidylate kinase